MNFWGVKKPKFWNQGFGKTVRNIFLGVIVLGGPGALNAAPGLFSLSGAADYRFSDFFALALAVVEVCG